MLQLFGGGMLFNSCGCSMGIGWEIMYVCILLVFSLCSIVDVVIAPLRFSNVVMDLGGATFFLLGDCFLA